MDDLEADQEDFVAMLEGDAVFGTVAVLKEHKGDIESDIDQGLATLNKKAGKIGALAVVLQPVEVPLEPDTPNPDVKVRFSVQVFDEPLLNQGETGTGKDFFQLARRVRQLGHRRNFGRGLYSWIGTEDAPQANPGRRSRIVTFEKRTQEEAFTRLGPPLIDPEDGGAAPQEVTLAAAVGTEIWYTLDQTYPSPLNPYARKYVAPIQVEAACTLRAVAYQDGTLPSDVASADFT